MSVMSAAIHLHVCFEWHTFFEHHATSTQPLHSADQPISLWHSGWLAWLTKFTRSLILGESVRDNKVKKGGWDSKACEHCEGFEGVFWHWWHLASFTGWDADSDAGGCSPHVLDCQLPDWQTTVALATLCVGQSAQQHWGPTGTALSPSLFTLYITDFNYHTVSCHLQKFSDASV